jgi:hypothetical protein
LQERSYKKWFKSRYFKQAPSHYFNTTSQLKSNQTIDEMFTKLNQDGSNILDLKQIAALFTANGINMTVE